MVLREYVVCVYVFDRFVCLIMMVDCFGMGSLYTEDNQVIVLILIEVVVNFLSIGML